MRILLPWLFSVHWVLGAAAMEFQPAADWEWHVKPTAANWGALATPSMLFRAERRADGAIVMIIAVVDANLHGVAKFRPVAFDEGGARHDFVSETAVSGGGQSLRSFSIKPSELPNGKIDYLGVEKLTERTIREVVAPRAVVTLRAAGVDALASPIVGQIYDFDLRALDGTRIRSNDLRGKVVLIDFWAGWCAPCIAALPSLKRAYGELHEKGFEIVGINMDFKSEDARELIAKHGLPWPNSIAPGDEGQRELWEQAAGVGGIPRAVVLNRMGVVVADLAGVDPEKLASDLSELVKE